MKEWQGHKSTRKKFTQSQLLVNDITQFSPNLIHPPTSCTTRGVDTNNLDKSDDLLTTLVIILP